MLLVNTIQYIWVKNGEGGGAKKGGEGRGGSYCIWRGMIVMCDIQCKNIKKNKVDVKRVYCSSKNLDNLDLST